MAKTVKGKTISYEDLTKEFSKIPIENLEETEKFLKGDHWQEGKGWIGYLPSADSPDEYAKIVLQIQRAFKAKNVLLGMIKRIAGAILGKEPDWKIVAKKKASEQINLSENPQQSEDDKKFEEIDEALTAWYSDKQVHKHLKQFIFNRAAYGKASLQIYIPQGYLNEKNQISVSSLKEALDIIFVRCPTYSEIINVKDPDFGRDFIVTRYKNEQDEEVFEVCYVDIDKKTYLRQVKQAKETAKQTIGEINCDLGMRLLSFVEGEFSEAVASTTTKLLQKGVNHALTSGNLALMNINYPDTTFINADLPTETKQIENKLETVVKPMKFGAGIWRNLKGLAFATADGGEQILTPSVKFREPADPEKFRKEAEKDAFDMHEEAGMGFVYISSNPYPSGESRIESMTDYIILLADNATLCDSLGLWLLQAVTRLALDFTNQSAIADDFSVIFSTKVTVGRLTVEERRLMLDEVLHNVRSRRNYQIKAEVTDDPVAEDKTIMLEFSMKPKEETDQEKDETVK